MFPTCARDGVDPGSVVLDDGAGASLHRQDVRHLENHVFGRRPAAQLSGQVHSDNLVHTERNSRSTIAFSLSGDKS